MKPRLDLRALESAASRHVADRWGSRGVSPKHALRKSNTPWRCLVSGLGAVDGTDATVTVALPISTALVQLGLGLALALLPSPVANAARPLKPVVEVEEELYRFTPANNGAGPMWCAGSTCIVRTGDSLFASGLETLPDVKPLNNCRWMLFQRGATGWQKIFSDPDGKTREPSPLITLGKHNILLSANPTLGLAPEPNGGPARPELFRFNAAAPAKPPERMTPVWKGEPRFTEHSYRSFASDGASGHFMLLQNIGYTHAEWTFADKHGRWAAQGRLTWPWGAEYDKPQPIRTCYPAVAVKNKAVYFFGVSDVLEPYQAWREHKRKLTGQAWDYDFRRLFYTWTPDVTTQQFRPWVEIASRDKTGGFVWPCDLRVGPDNEVQLLWTERAIDERLRESFFPKARQSHGLYYGVVRDGELVAKQTILESTEDKPGLHGSAARFHEAPGRRLFVVFYASGVDEEGKAVSENRVFEISRDSKFSRSVRIPLAKPFTTYFTATTRAGSPPSSTLDMLGQRQGETAVMSYARVQLY